jgi:hypothetical protein
VRHIVALFTVSLGLLVSQTCVAGNITINFSDYPEDGSTGISSYSTDGYTFFAGDYYLYPATPNIGGGNYDPPAGMYYYGTNAMGVGGYEDATFTQNDLGNFDLLGIALGSFSSSQTDLPIVTITANGGQTVTETVTEAGVLQFFPVSLVDTWFIILSAVDADGNPVSFQFTDVVVPAAPPGITSVPEPTSILLLGIGIGVGALSGRSVKRKIKRCPDIGTA